MRKSWYLATTIALGLAAASAAQAQTTYIWNDSTQTWEASTAWTPNSPAGGPTAADLAEFTSNFTLLPTLKNPVLSSSSDQALSLIVGNNYQGLGRTFTGSGTLTLGGTGSVGLTTVGVGTYTFNGPTIAGSSTINTAAFNIGGGSMLVLAGASTATTNIGTFTLQGGLTLDNRVTNNLSRLATGSPIIFNGGSLTYLANAAGGTMSVGNPTFSASNNTVTVYQPSGGSGTAQLDFTIPTSKSLRGGTSMTVNFAATSVLPGTTGTNTAILGTSGTQIHFSTAPLYNTTSRLLANTQTATAATVGWATVTDAGGTDFAILTSDLQSIQSAINSPTYVTGNNVTTLQTTATLQSVLQYSPTQSETGTATLNSATLRITPSTSGLTLDMGANTISAQGLMLDGANDYTINGTNTTKGLLGIGSTRYIFVNNASTTLFTNMIVGIGSSGSPTSIAGPGFLVLTGTTSQNTATLASALNFLGGTVRANNTQLNFNGSGGTGGLMRFTGGVLEITGGTNGTGASADFSRTLGTAAGNVAYSSGGGGFSAFGATASVSIGGATPATIQWDAASLMPSGAPLIFGSTKSNARLNFLNPINLTTATTANAGNYAERQFNIIGNSSDTGTANAGDFTDVQGAISGNANSDLIKTGTGVLQLSGANTYDGNTLINGGTLVAASTSATGTGAVLVNSGGRLGAGTSGGTVRTVILNSGGAIKPTVAIVGDTGPTTLTVSSALILNGGTFGSAIAGYGWTLGTDFINASGATFDANVANTTFNFTSGASSGTYNLVSYGTLGSGLSSGSIASHFTASGATGTFALNANILQFIISGNSGGAMPEPGTFAMLAAGLLPVGGLLLRRKRHASA